MQRPLRMILVLGLLLTAPLAGATAFTVMAQEATELDLWLNTTSGSNVAECIVANAVEPFNALGNGITIDATIQPNNWPATQTAVAGGAGPDIVSTPGPSFALELARAGRLVPLDP